MKALLDREAIRDCLYRYCRGIDRADEEMLRSAYWPDGTDNHGPYQGSAAGFVDWAMKTLPYIERGIHQIHNVLIEFRAGGAVVESYFSAFQRQMGPERKLQKLDMKGRYLDWFTERDGEWRIQDRLVVFDWVEEMDVPPGTEEERFGPMKPIGGRAPDDPIYTLLKNKPA
ncbi:nuclear transport factor 2 family protein [Henriciella aquimarina]|uniref:nuclear transport factor 2 family protein n=1 Tax=Henriciella aquimarina TaxID=545261 RepID=UPI001F315F19|nr:nuclear transport factor 2 family protein [Henriciella aquimarina]